MNRFNDSESKTRQRVLRSDSIDHAEKIEEEGEKYLGKCGRFKDEPGLFALMECQQIMNFGNYGNNQDVIFTFARIEDNGQPALDWSEIFQF